MSLSDKIWSYIYADKKNLMAKHPLKAKFFGIRAHGVGPHSSWSRACFLLVAAYPHRTMPITPRWFYAQKAEKMYGGLRDDGNRCVAQKVDKI